MKSFVSTFSAFAIALFLVGCGGGQVETSPEEEAAIEADALEMHDEMAAGMAEEGEEMPAEGAEEAPSDADPAEATTE